MEENNKYYEFRVTYFIKMQFDDNSMVGISYLFNRLKIK